MKPGTGHCDSPSAKPNTKGRRNLSKKDQSATTLAELLTAARRHFAESGYEGCRTETLVTEIGTTRGAIYYHFKNKRELFAATVEEISREIEDFVDDFPKTGNPVDDLLTGCERFLRKCTEPDIARIYILEGPSILGWSQWRSIDYANAASGLLIAIEAAVGDAPPNKLLFLRAAISGLLNELALFSLESDRTMDFEELLGQTRASIAALLATVDPN